MASSSKDTKESKDSLVTRTGGAYIPPMKLKMMMQQQVADKGGVGYQRLSWEALKKSIHGFVNKVNASNIANVVRELFGENLIRGRGLLARSLIQCQTFSPTYTNVFAALVAVVNTKFPAIGELLVKRLIISFRKGYKRRDKNLCLSSTRFVAHLVNQQVVHEILGLEILMLLLEQPTDDSVEVAIALLKECGARLKLVSPRGLVAITDRLRAVLHEAQIDPRTQYMIEVMFAVIKDNFKDYPIVISELDLVEEGDQVTHMLSLEDDYSEERELDVFKYDPDFLDNEAKYEEIKREIIGDDDDDEVGEEGSGDEEADEEGESNEPGQSGIIDNTEINMVNLRRTIYLAIQSSLNFEEAAHKLLKMTLKPEQEQELCYMIIDCCAQLRTYEKFYGLLAERFCKINAKFVPYFEQIFKEQYDTSHRLELMKLRNVAKCLAHLLFSDAINWSVLSCITLTEDGTTSSGRIFIKILFQELAEHMGVGKLNERLQDPTLKGSFQGIFPTDSPKNIRFSINFFTAIGLGGLTDELRDVLKNQQKPNAQLQQRLDQLANSTTQSNLVVKQEVEEKLIKKEKKEKKSKKAKKQKKRRNSSSSASKSSESLDLNSGRKHGSSNVENFPVRVKQERVSADREEEPIHVRQRASRSKSPYYRRDQDWRHHSSSPSPKPSSRHSRSPDRRKKRSPSPHRHRRSPSPMDRRRQKKTDRSNRRSPSPRRQRSRTNSRSPPPRNHRLTKSLKDRSRRSHSNSDSYDGKSISPRRQRSDSRSRRRTPSRSPTPPLRGTRKAAASRSPSPRLQDSRPRHRPSSPKRRRSVETSPQNSKNRQGERRKDGTSDSKYPVEPKRSRHDSRSSSSDSDSDSSFSSSESSSTSSGSN